MIFGKSEQIRKKSGTDRAGGACPPAMAGPGSERPFCETFFQKLMRQNETKIVYNKKSFKNRKEVCHETIR